MDFKNAAGTVEHNMTVEFVGSATLCYNLSPTTTSRSAHTLDSTIHRIEQY